MSGSAILPSVIITGIIPYYKQKLHWGDVVFVPPILNCALVRYARHIRSLFGVAAIFIM